jgi:hypothetical protein
MLDMVGGIADKVRPVSPVGTKDAYLIIRPEGTGQETIGVETLKPLELWATEKTASKIAALAPDRI